ncbi:MAG: Macrolide export ATP-binding/permease protein MacB [Parcubacteria group bacterium ADurb.Bin316]|nr:MAG: Macrolide export ATP-binding/permease protein MacB [Parcubacteria group bacterium ADurb.Bin316]HOZ56394.1 ABC transporter permease [bacterium]
MILIVVKSIKTSIKALLSNKARSFLTMLGIIIGVAAVIIIMSLGAGAQSLILSQVKSLGTNLIGILPGGSEKNEPPASVMGITITTLTYDDLLAISDKKNVPHLVAVVGYYNGQDNISWQNNLYNTSLRGSTVGYLDVEGGEVAQGRFFTEEEERNLARVVVLGSTVKKELFGESDALGQYVKIKKQTFQVVGVMKGRGTVAMQDYDDQVFIPLKTMQKLIAGVNHLGLIRAKVDYDENVERTIEDVKITLREQHNIKDQSGKNDDFSVRSAAQALDMISTITNALKYFLAAIAALSLVVGGIGIMNIMLVSVTERTREIGLRKAVGANNFNIMMQFLSEAVTITMIGGIVGIVLGTVISYIVSLVFNILGYDWEFVVSMFSILIAVSISALIGIIFGLFPASRASRLEPVEALRHE